MFIYIYIYSIINYLNLNLVEYIQKLPITGNTICQKDKNRDIGCDVPRDVTEEVTNGDMAASGSGMGESDFAGPLSAPPPTTTAADGEPSVEKKGEPSPSYPPARLPSRNASSKYDFVKVG